MIDFAFATAPEIIRELGRRLRARRIAAPFTQEELAGRAGVSVGAVKKLEATGRTTLETFIRVAQALGLTDDLNDFMAPKPVVSIAAMERAHAATERQRVRHPVRKPTVDLAP